MIQDYPLIHNEAAHRFEMEIEGLGILKNTIVKDEDDFSILSRKK